MKKSLDNYRELSSKNPQNVLYKEQIQNYETMVKHAKTLDANKTTQTGVDAALAMSTMPLGTRIQIEGNIFEGSYTLKNVKSPFSGKHVPSWVEDGGNHHAFLNEKNTNLSELRLIRGGVIKNSKTSKIKIIK